MIDDLRPEPYFSAGVPYFNSCTSCGISNVLKPGDYCVACAGTWRLPSEDIDEYIIVTEDTIEEAVYQSDLSEMVMREKMAKAAAANQHYVIFFAQDSWQDIVIHTLFHVPTVMHHLFYSLGHK